MEPCDQDIIVYLAEVVTRQLGATLNPAYDSHGKISFPYLANVCLVLSDVAQCAVGNKKHFCRQDSPSQNMSCHRLYPGFRKEPSECLIGGIPFNECPCKATLAAYRYGAYILFCFILRSTWKSSFASLRCQCRAQEQPAPCTKLAPSLARRRGAVSSIFIVSDHLSGWIVYPRAGTSTVVFHLLLLISAANYTRIQRNGRSKSFQPRFRFILRLYEFEVSSSCKDAKTYNTV